MVACFWEVSHSTKVFCFLVRLEARTRSDAIRRCLNQRLSGLCALHSVSFARYESFALPTLHDTRFIAQNRTEQGNNRLYLHHCETMAESDPYFRKYHECEELYKQAKYTECTELALSYLMGTCLGFQSMKRSVLTVVSQHNRFQLLPHQDALTACRRRERRLGKAEVYRDSISY